MIFSSIFFLYVFLPITLILYYAVPKPLKNAVLLLASLVFYGWGEPSYVFLMVGSIIVGYVTGILVEKFEKPALKRTVLIISLVINLGLLGYFKYADFFIENFNKATGLSVPLLKVALPIGISFYTFQLISYVIDVYWRNVKAQKNLISLATYITMFPQLIAGPIVRYSDVEKQLSERTHDFSKISYGIKRFILGLSKKILIANVLGEFCSIFNASDEKSVLFYWAYAVAVSLHIYFDFSGYSDMAIGLGRILGFRFMENFNYPYISKSITEFWRRWHMSLGTWFRDYVYIPLGGSRVKAGRHISNILFVWMLTGFWHGAAWNFVLWGLFFAVLLMVEKLFLLKYLEKAKVLNHAYVLFSVIISFVIFNGTSMGQIASDIGGMFGMGSVPLVTFETIYYLKSYVLIFALAIVSATPLPKIVVSKIKAVQYLEPLAVIVLFVMVTAYLVDGSFNPFLYFRF